MDVSACTCVRAGARARVRVHVRAYGRAGVRACARAYVWACVRLPGFGRGCTYRRTGVRRRASCGWAYRGTCICLPAKQGSHFFLKQNLIFTRLCFRAHACACVRASARMSVRTCVRRPFVRARSVRAYVRAHVLPARAVARTSFDPLCEHAY